MSQEALELRDAAVANQWLAAGLCTMRLARPQSDVTAQLVPWIVGVLSESGTVPPVGVIADLGLALLAGTSLPPRGLPIDDAGLRKAVRMYESDLLGRFQSESRLQSAADAIARLPLELRAEAVSVFLSTVLRRLDYRGVSVQSGAVRRLTSKSTESLVEAGLGSLSRHGEVVDALVDGYTQLVRCSHRIGGLITDADVFVLEHLAILRTQSQRVAIEQVVEASSQLSAVLPKRLRRQTRRGPVPTAMEDSAQYPVGGFTSIETSGAIENLVTSELVYMDDDEARAAGVMDLFDVRYVEGELLFYSRDESVLVREQRVFTFVLGQDLVRARFKDKDVRWQRLVVVQGLLLCLIQRLSEWLSESGLQFRIVFLAGPTGQLDLVPEEALCKLLLSEWIEKGVANITEVGAWADIMTEAAAAGRKGQSDVLAFTFGPMADLKVDERVRLIPVDVSQAAPAVLPRSTAREGETSWQAWLRLTSELSRTLV
jgi:hypothetical protein